MNGLHLGQEATGSIPGLGPPAHCRRRPEPTGSGSWPGQIFGKVIFGVDSIDGFFDLSTWIAAIAGSVILLALYRLVTGNRHSHRHATR
ncbi:hypothetical protein AQJ84_27450 [Streptomyces resistomycificus]|nr:GlsB/YeaQ/YmgE family stress response membrane protein [Streptomyces resistomycificus]KUN94410.1 hypothetical protein AQJ84_27450 [Streptomyces resistomycificus]